VLAIAGDEGKGFWCGLFVDGDYRPRFQHRRLTGPRSFEENPASIADVQVLCGYFGAAVVVEDVYEALSSHYYTNALDCHTATARSLGLPSWSVGMGYSRILDGSVPPEAGTPTKPPSCLADLRPSPNGSMTSRQPMRQSGSSRSVGGPSAFWRRSSGSGWILPSLRSRSWRSTAARL
jgi:hypothetical protein